MQNTPFNIPSVSKTSPPIDAINTPLVLNNQWRLDELNIRLSSRIYPDYIIPQSITPRGIETRQTILGKSTDPRNLISNTDIIKYPLKNSSIKDNFISGDNADPNWFLANIDTETILRNQCFALQKGGMAPQATFIPNNNSELYKSTMPHNSNVVEQPFPFLFEKTQFNENRRMPVKGVNTTDNRNKYIMDTYNGNLYRGGITQYKNENKVFYNIDRASLSKPFNG
jgi:hypothetical protein